MALGRCCGLTIKLFLLTTLLFGCVPANLGKGDEAKEATADFRFPVRVAVLPFVNLTEEPTAPEILRRLFFNFFSSLNYRDVELFSVDQKLRNSGLYEPIAQGESYSLNKVCQSLDVDAVIIGEVTSYDKLFAVVYAQREVGLKAEFRLCDGNVLLWSRDEKAIERDGSLFRDVTALFVTVVKTYFNHKRASSVQNAAKLCMSMVESIPNPLEVSYLPPKIKQMIHNGADRIIKPGEAMRVVMVGEPGLQGSWDIHPNIQNLFLEESSPGIYTGEYIVQKNDRVVAGRVDGQLIGKTGATATWRGVGDGIFLGKPTIPPLSLKQNTVFTAAKSPYLIKDLLLVQSGVTLTVNPGTIILLQNAGIVVQGRIEAVGDSKKPIVMAGLAGRSWRGLFLERGAKPSLLKYVTVRDARYGVKVGKTTIKIENSAFLDNTWGVVVEVGGSVRMQSSLVNGSEAVGISVKGADLELLDNRVTKNSGGGIQQLDSKILLRNNDIFKNGPWEFFNHDKNRVLELPNNWWGSKELKAVQLRGDVTIRPMLTRAATQINMQQTSSWK